MRQLSAMRERNVGIAAICFPKNYVVFDNGLSLPIYGYLDENREPTEEMDEYCYAEFGDEEHGFGTLDIAWYQMDSYADH